MKGEKLYTLSPQWYEYLGLANYVHERCFNAITSVYIANGIAIAEWKQISIQIIRERENGNGKIINNIEIDRNY